MVGEKFSPTFNFDAGSAQGDPPSPLIFDLCIDPLIIKIERAKLLSQIPRRILSNGSNLDLSEVEVYADDMSPFITPSVENLRAFLSIFDSFYRLSGLSLNESKTILIPLGSNRNDLPAFIERVGNHCPFGIEDNIKILGIQMDNKLENLNVNWDSLVVKLNNIIKFWEKFYLSIFGRINMCKTYLYPNVNFISNILPIDKRQIDRITKIIYKFAIGKDKVSVKILTTDREKGGLGLPPLSTFLLINKGRACSKINLHFDDPLSNIIKLSSWNNELNTLYISKNDQSNLQFYGDLISSFIKTKSLIEQNSIHILESHLLGIVCNDNFAMTPNKLFLHTPFSYEQLNIRIKDFIFLDPNRLGLFFSDLGNPVNQNGLLRMAGLQQKFRRIIGLQNVEHNEARSISYLMSAKNYQANFSVASICMTTLNLILILS